MSSKVSTLTVALKDDVSGPAAKVGQALRKAGEQAKAMARALDGTGASKTFANQLARLGLSAKEIDRVSGSLREYTRAAGLADKASDWTKADQAKVRAWEASVVASLRHVKAEQAKAQASAQAAIAASAQRRAPYLTEPGARPPLAVPARRHGAGSRVIEDARGTLAGAFGAYEVASAYKQAASFDRRLTMIGQTADAGRAEIDRLGGSLHKLAQETATPIDKLAGGLEALVAQGRNLRESMDFLPSVARTAAASASEVDDIAKTADSVGSNFSITAQEMQKAFDIMAAGGKAGQFELKDMARYLPSLSPAAKAAGFNGQKGLADIVAMLQTIRKGSGSAEEAATSMTNVFTKLESDETTKNFKEMGVDLEAAMKKGRKEGRNLVEVLEELTAKATKGDLSLIPKLFKDQEFARGMRALMTYRGEWQKLSGELQRSSGGTVMRDIVQVTQDAQASLDRLDNSWKRFTQTAARLGDAGGVSKGLGDTAKELEQIAQALERANAAWEKSTLKKLIGGDAKGAAADTLPERKDTQDGQIKDMEADLAATEATLRRTGRSEAQIEAVLRTKRLALAAARRARADLELETGGYEKKPLRMGNDPAAPIQGEAGPITPGIDSWQKAYPIEVTSPKAMKAAPLPPQRPDGMVSQGGIDRVEDVLGPVKREGEAAKAALDQINATTVAPQTDASALSGLVEQFDALRGKAGEVNGLTITPQVNGSALGTIIQQLQQIISLSRQASQAAGSVSGPQSGGIRARVSSPSFSDGVTPGAGG